ncbi:MAG: hypothetical protein KatS3mg129_2526 [Leptospiraceae bacterium]|nr:MAG: hypothetical protein KatS3mg129_2526 [Leptospiraceae bacterium]
MTLIFTEKLKQFLHDPIDKPFDIIGHESRAKKYAEILNIPDLENISKKSDLIASCMERSFIPKAKNFGLEQSEFYQKFNEIRHPLCEGKLSNICELSINEIQPIIEKIFTQIKKDLGTFDDKVYFFYIWRNLNELLKKELPDSYKKIVPILPADTRVPDHSIWEHNKIASALAIGEKNDSAQKEKNSLYLFSIGPVQSFISQARKIQDFYVGSYILSYLTFKAIEIIINKYGPTSIIYPDLLEQPLMDYYIEKNLNIHIINSQKGFTYLPTIPNRFVAILPEIEKNKIIELTDQIKKHIIKTIEESKQYIKKKVKDIFEKLDPDNQNYLENKIEEQFKEFPEIYWVSVPLQLSNYNDITIDNLKEYFNEDKINNFIELKKYIDQNGEYPTNIGFLYELLYSTLEKFHGGIKNLRKFKQSQNEEGRKCHVCGERDILFFYETGNKNKFKRYNPFALDLTNKISLKYLSNGEGLCAICFYKRVFLDYLKDKELISRNFSFPSIAEITTADFKIEIFNNDDTRKIYNKLFIKLKELLEPKIGTDYILISPIPYLSSLLRKENNLNEENIEGEFLYEEKYTKEVFKKEFNLDIEQNELNEIKKDLKEIYKKLNLKPSKYYAVLYFDGDNMGKWLSGALLPSIEFSYNSEVWKKLPNEFKQDLENLLPRNDDEKPRKLLTPAIHATISAALKNYTIKFVRKIVEEEHLGKLIYAGGDDVVAIVNLKDLLDIMHKLRWAFSGNIRYNGNIQIDYKNITGFVDSNDEYILTMGNRATGSMGVAIAHYKTPLQLVISKAQKMEKEAKNNGRNCFGICLMKRSGEEREIVYPWKKEYNTKKADIEFFDVIDILKEIRNTFKEDQDYYISRSFIYKLSKEFEIFFNNKIENNQEIHLKEIFIKELERQLKRSFYTKEDNKKNEDAFLDKTLKNLLNLIEVKENIKISDFIQTLVISYFLANYNNQGE